MGIFGKLRDFVGVNDQVDYEYEYDEMDGQEYQDLYQEEAAPVQEDNASGFKRLALRPLV
jgi:cell division inhibitor SepF